MIPYEIVSNGNALTGYGFAVPGVSHLREPDNKRFALLRSMLTLRLPKATAHTDRGVSAARLDWMIAPRATRATYQSTQAHRPCCERHFFNSLLETKTPPEGGVFVRTIVRSLDPATTRQSKSHQAQTQ